MKRKWIEESTTVTKGKSKRISSISDIVEDTNIPPYNAVAYMETFFSDSEKCTGTGFVATCSGRKLLVTCGHNVCQYSDETKTIERCREVDVYFGYNRDASYAYSFSMKGSEFYIPCQNLLNSNIFDFAIAEIDESIAKMLGFLFELELNFQKTETEIIGNACKYPSLKFSMAGYHYCANGDYTMWQTDVGDLLEFDCPVTYYDATTPVNSGSPIFSSQSNGNYVAVGIHVSNEKIDNKALLFSEMQGKECFTTGKNKTKFILHLLFNIK